MPSAPSLLRSKEVDLSWPRPYRSYHHRTFATAWEISAAFAPMPPLRDHQTGSPGNHLGDTGGQTGVLDSLANGGTQHLAREMCINQS